jgi:hypothetical protein
MMPVFTHPRCINCHGAVNPTTGAGHGGGVITTESCTSGCHDQADNDNRTGLDDWNLPVPEHWFVGKDARALCAQMPIWSRGLVLRNSWITFKTTF